MDLRPCAVCVWGFSTPWSFPSGHWSCFIIGWSKWCFGRGGLKIHQISKFEVGSHATSLLWCLQGQEGTYFRQSAELLNLLLWQVPQLNLQSLLCLLEALNALWPSGEFPSPVLLILLPRGNLARCVSEALFCLWMSLSCPDCRICVTISSELDPCDTFQSSLVLWCWHLILGLYSWVWDSHWSHQSCPFFVSHILPIMICRSDLSFHQVNLCHNQPQRGKQPWKSAGWSFQWLGLTEEKKRPEFSWGWNTLRMNKNRNGLRNVQSVPSLQVNLPLSCSPELLGCWKEATS